MDRETSLIQKFLLITLSALHIGVTQHVVKCLKEGKFWLLPPGKMQFRF